MEWNKQTQAYLKKLDDKLEEHLMASDLICWFHMITDLVVYFYIAKEENTYDYDDEETIVLKFSTPLYSLAGKLEDDVQFLLEFINKEVAGVAC